MTKYGLEFILQSSIAAEDSLKGSLSGLGEGLEIEPMQCNGGPGSDFKVSMICREPTLVFDVCSQFGRIKTVRISEA